MMHGEHGCMRRSDHSAVRARNDRAAARGSGSGCTGAVRVAMLLISAPRALVVRRVLMLTSTGAPATGGLGGR